MKTKNISRLLLTGVILNSLNLNSFASILSEDGRYETFEGNNITIDNILEEDKVDIEIEGNTMVNVANQKDEVPITKSYTVEGVNHIPLQGEYDGKAKPVIEGNTMYYNNDTGEFTDTFIEGANLSLISSFEDQLVTQEMVDNGQEKAENLGKYKVEYKVTGKNKFNINGDVNQYYKNMNVGSNSIVNVVDGSKLIANLFSNQHHGKGQIIKVQPNTNYTISLDILNNSGAVVIHTNKINNYHLKYFSIGHHETTFNTGDNQEICLAFITHGDSTTTKAVFSNIQIEEGSVSTEYDIYKESIKTLYLNSPLLEGDTIEDVNGKATHVRRWKYSLDDLDDWICGNWDMSGKTYHYQIGANSTTGNMISANKEYPLLNSSTNTIEEGIRSYNDDRYNQVNLRISKSKLNNVFTIESLKEYLKLNPIKNVIYELATPIYETISDESILIDSYKDGHLDLNTNVPVNKIDFTSTATNLNYLYPSTEYTVQFESDNIGKIDKVLLGNEVLYSDYIVNKGINRFNITTPNNITSTELILDGVGFNLSNLVVTEGIKEDFDYFEGMKSVGQDDVNGHKIEISLNNKNLFDCNIGSTSEIVGDDGVIHSNNKWLLYDFLPIESNIEITISENYVENQYFQYRIAFYDKDKNFLGVKTLANHLGFGTTKTPDSTAFYRLGYSVTFSDESIADRENIMIEFGDKKTDYVPYQSNKIEIPLPEPLRSLPNGVKDRIIKRNGQWVVERNCKEYILDGSEDYWIESSNYSDVTLRFVAFPICEDTIPTSQVYSNNFPYLGIRGSSDEECVFMYGKRIQIFIKKEKVATLTEFKSWLSNNSVSVIYQLSNPVYEPLNVDSVLNTYLDVTHVSNNSNIPTNLKITVDRAINRAVEAIELAKINPTVANISQARMWSNLLKESIKKDELNNEINIITNIEDLQLERKTASANMDVYIKSENMLLMSLSTNNVTFNDYSGVNDMELNNAVNISINSSLPYQLNSYLLSEIENSDKNNRIEKDLLNIKSSSDTDYKNFNDINEKLVLEDDCDAGNNKSHSIDLKLKGSQAHKADIYKTVIKFEAEQK